MGKEVNAFINARKKLFAAFGCPDDYPVKPMLDCHWRIQQDAELFFLVCRPQDTPSQTQFVVVKQEGKPMVFQTPEHTLVVSIDCVKTAFLLANHLASNV